MSVEAERALLAPINATAAQWHRTAEELATPPMPGDRRMVRLLGELEGELDGFWQRRRRLLALAFARSARLAPFVREYEEACRKYALFHVRPVC